MMPTMTAIFCRQKAIIGLQNIAFETTAAKRPHFVHGSPTATSRSTWWKHCLHFRTTILFILCRKKAEFLESFVEFTIKKSLEVIKTGGTPRYTSNGRCTSEPNSYHQWTNPAPQDITDLIAMINGACPFIIWKKVYRIPDYIVEHFDLQSSSTFS